MESENPFLFVIGAPRSGTTLLQRILDAHPLLTIPNDADFIWRPQGVGGGRDPEVTPQLVAWVQENRDDPLHLQRLELTEQEVERAAASSTRWSEFVSAMYDEVARKRGKRYAGQKDPTYAEQVPTLHGLFPNARFLHIIRDGRDVALSMLDWAAKMKPGQTALWAERPIAYCAVQWRSYVLAAWHDSEALPEGQVMQIWYENLVRDPVEGARSICIFLGLPLEEEKMAAFHVGREVKDREVKDVKLAWAPVKKNVRDWRNTLPQEDIALFEAIAGDALVRLGYPLVTEQTEELRELADRARRWWREGQPAGPVLAAA